MVFVATAPEESARWADAARDDVSLSAYHAVGLADALRILDAQDVDVAIVAERVSDASYRDLLRALQLAREDLPVVVVGALDDDAVHDAFALGAADVVATSDLLRLGRAITRGVRDGVLSTQLRRARVETALLDETLRRTREDVAIVGVDASSALVVYATRHDLVGRPLSELPYVRDGEEAEELTATVGALRAARLTVASGSIVVEPLGAPPGERRYVAVTHERGGRTALDERDPLTGLPQRSTFERLAQDALAEAEREGSSVAVLFLDVDRFHVINELADHSTGDRILREIAGRLRTALPNAHVARFGGDEFVVLRAEDEPGAARATAQAAVSAFAAPFIIADKAVYLTASVGIALAPDDASDVPALIGTAEAAVFEAKRLGRNTVRWYRSSGGSASLERVVMRRDLHGAIERNEFEVYYQPMYDLGTEAIHGVEALLRWRHPVHGLILPDRFIPVAEECGLIEEIGGWVLERAIAQVRSWADAGIPAIRVSVNVSARQLESNALPALVTTLLTRYGVAASCLDIEITESAIMRDVASAARLLRRLRELGVRVSIDDFGTGYTSLVFLKRFPVDQLKIDRSFVVDVAHGAFDGAVIRAVTTLARALGVQTVAEGVELPAQVERLRALDCDLVQGFLFCEPLPVAACTPLLAARAIRPKP
ncbi:MAG: bifunctional diguanylate cyclase/phosphodiesterase [Vulcanimicrobiaceae bacterium]